MQGSPCARSAARAFARPARPTRARAERLEEAVSGAPVGLAAIEADTTSASDALAEADAACYQAKAAGRNAIAG